MSTGLRTETTGDTNDTPRMNCNEKTRQQLSIFFNGKLFHRIFSSLLIFDCIVVLTDMIVLLLICGNDTNKGHHGFDEIILEILPIVSIILLILFEIELSLQIYAFGFKFFKKILHTIDVFIVTITLILEIIFHFIIRDREAEFIASLTVFMRLWRLVRVLQVTREAIDLKNESKFENLEEKNKLLVNELNKWKTGQIRFKDP